jgi:hypothetical protein
MKYTPRSDVELETLAFDAFSGKIFTSFDCPRVEDLPMVFMVLALMTKEQLVALKGETEEETPYIFYEYLSEAGPRSVNGMPTFFSVRYLNKTDFEKFKLRYTEIDELFKARKEKAGGPL